MWHRSYDDPAADSWSDKLQVTDDDGSNQRWVYRFEYVIGSDRNGIKPELQFR